MATFAVSMVKDEADIVGTTVAHMAGQVDEVLVADNGSSDGTSEILHELDVTVVHDDEVGYYQSAKITALAHRCGAGPGDWVVPFDADEVHVTADGTPLGDVLGHLAGVDVALADLFDHVASAADDCTERDPVRRIGWHRTEPAPLQKVAARWRPDLVIEQGNHGAHYLDGTGTTAARVHTVRHFPYRSVDQLVRKVRNGAKAYAATDLPEHFGAHWREWGQLLEAGGEAAIAELFYTWYWAADPAATGLVFDPCPLS